MVRLQLLLLVLVWVPVESVSKDYIVKLFSNCKYSESNGVVTSALLTLKVDLPFRSVTVKAECLNNTKDFDQKDSVTYTLPVYYDVLIGGNNCIFRNVSGYSFSTKVMIAYGTPGGYIQQYKEQYTISCSLNYGMGNASDFQVGEGFLAPKEIQGHVGNKTENVSMTIVNVLGHDITTSSIPIGRIVHLKGIFYGDAKGILATSCYAVGDNRLKYPFLRGGCGDGLILDKLSGFETVLGEALSEPFEFFGIEGATTVSFYCNFTICETMCEKNSCYLNAKNRVKRNSVEATSGHWIMVHTGSVRFVGFQENALPSVNVKTKGIKWPVGDVSKNNQPQFIVARTNPVEFLDENVNETEAATKVISFLQPNKFVNKKLALSTYLYSNPNVVFKILVSVVFCVSILSISLSLSLYLITNKLRPIVSELSTA